MEAFLINTLIFSFSCCSGLDSENPSALNLLYSQDYLNGYILTTEGENK